MKILCLCEWQVFRHAKELSILGIGNDLKWINIDDFFIEENRIKEVTNRDYQLTDTIRQVVDAYSRASNESVYIIDYFRRDFLFVPDNPLFLCGHTADYVKEMGYAYYQEHVPAEEFEMLAKINKAAFVFSIHNP